MVAISLLSKFRISASNPTLNLCTSALILGRSHISYLSSVHEISVSSVYDSGSQREHTDGAGTVFRTGCMDGLAVSRRISVMSGLVRRTSIGKGIRDGLGGGLGGSIPQRAMVVGERGSGEVE